MLRYFYWLLSIFFVLGFYVWQQTQSVRLGYQVDNLRLECEKWNQENDGWRLRVTRLMSVDRLDGVARERNLVIPNEASIIYLP